MITIDPKKSPTAWVHSQLLAGVAPRPIALASTIDKDGNPNLSPFSFFNVFSAKPPIAIFSPARRVRDNTQKHTLENIKEVPEVVINAVNYEIVQQTSLSSTEYPKTINEFTKAGLTPLASELIKPFRVKESPFQLECKVNEIIELGQEGGAGNLIICEIMLIHISEHVLDASGKIDQNKIDLVARLGGNWYCRTSGNSLFEVEKPLTTMGIGIDLMPDNIKKSNILTGNDLGMLGNVENLPDETTVNEFKLLELSEIFIEHKDSPQILEAALHKIAQGYISKGKINEAWKTLLAFNG